MKFEGRFEGKVAIVTGSGKGMGYVTALRFASEGAAVVINDIDQGLLDKAEKSIKATGAKVLALNVDVSDSKQVKGMVDRTIEEFGRIDILVNNVGVDWGNMEIDQKEEDWDRLIDIDLKSQFLCCQAVVPHMKAQKDGRIVNISSNAARGRSRVTSYAYDCAKAGVIILTHKLAIELAQYGIRANYIAPGNTGTEEGKKGWATAPKEVTDLMLANTPMRRLAEPEEIAAATTFLASDDASFITGTCIDVDGGTLGTA